jgi:prepilin-type N-terminal cleavage/methylation domain-containing protein/prepilin-type processing-associated H-X9-DG protein
MRRAFTLIEILMVIAVIGILITLLLPAIQAARETARRHSCANNLAQIVLATQNYAAAHGVLPPGTINATGPIHSRPVGYHISWVAQVLPFLEQGNVYRHIDFSVGAYDPKNAEMRDLHLALLRCPTDRGGWSSNGKCNYAGCHHDVEAPIDVDNHGVLFLNSAVRWQDIADGPGQTIFLGEKLIRHFELGWLSGTRSTLRNTGTRINGTTSAGGPLSVVVDLGAVGGPAPSAGELKSAPVLIDNTRPIWQYPGDEQNTDRVEHEFQPPAVPGGMAPSLVVGGFESDHPQGAQFAFGDGSVRYVSQDIDFTTYQRLAHRADGKLLDDRF